MTSRQSRIASKVAARYLNTSPRPPQKLSNFEDKHLRNKIAGEVRFVKDNGPLARDIPSDFNFKSKNLKALGKTLWSLSVSLGHISSAYSRFTKIKSVNVSPDGMLGGKGYIQNIKDMRSNLTECVETISNAIDTLHDEIRAEHWMGQKKDLPKKDQKEIEEILSDSEEIMDDPEGFADKEYKEEVLDDIKD